MQQRIRSELYVHLRKTAELEYINMGFVPQII